jgi:hypothetical protein
MIDELGLLEVEILDLLTHAVSDIDRNLFLHGLESDKKQRRLLMETGEKCMVLVRF